VLQRAGGECEVHVSVREGWNTDRKGEKKQHNESPFYVRE